ncbi:hypothetical protein Tco_1214769 [Tanacetum coccineum]
MVGKPRGFPMWTIMNSLTSESELVLGVNMTEDDNNNDQHDNKDEEEFDQENESKYDEMKSNEEQGMDDTTDQFDDDADARLEEPTETATEIVQGKGTNAEMTEAQQGNENLATTQEQVVDDAHVTITTVTKKTEVPVTSSSCSSNLASKFLNFSNIPHTDVEIVSPMDVPVHHEFPRTQAPTLLSIPFYATPTPPPTIETTNPLSNLLIFLSLFNSMCYNFSFGKKEVAELKKDPLYTQVTSLVDEHLDTRLGETREEFMNLLSESFTTRIKEQVKDQLPQILPQEVSNFAPPVIEKCLMKTRDEKSYVGLDKSSLFCQDFFFKKSYDLDKDFFYSYDVYTLKRGREDKDKDDDPSDGSDRGLKNRKTSKDAEPTTKEPVFKVADSDMPQDQEGNLGDTNDEPRNKTASRED